METFPDINDPIVLRDEDDRTYRSRVEDSEPGVLTIARPLDLPAEHGFDLDAEFIVGWTSLHGIAFLPAQLVRTRTEGAVRLWVLAITGPAWSEQRREFVRIVADGPVTLRPLAETPDIEDARGQLLDVSEAALCCTVDDRSTAGTLAEGAELSVGFGLGGTAFDLRGQISHRRPSDRSSALAEVVVRFDESGRTADQLRREIFAQQLRLRRRRPD